MHAMHSMFRGGRSTLPVLLCVAALLPGGGCVKVKTEVEPIEVNVTVRLKIDRELDAFFGELDARNPTLKAEDPEDETVDGEGVQGSEG